MSVGHGNISFTGKPPVATPAAVQGARNGLSIDALLNAVLGQDVGAVGDPGQLLSNREIPLNGFFLNIFGGDMQLYIDGASGQAAIGDYDNYSNPVIAMSSNAGGNYMELWNSDVPGNIFSDLIILPAAFTWDFDNNVNSSQLDVNQEYFYFNQGSDDVLAIDPLGDYYNIGNDDAHLQFGSDYFEYKAQNNRKYIDIDLNNNNFYFGDRTDGPELYMESGNGGGNTIIKFGMLLGANPAAGIMSAVANGGTNSVFRFGDIDIWDGGITMVLENSTGEIAFGNSASNAKVRMNGILGVTGVFAPVNSITVNGGIVTAVT